MKSLNKFIIAILLLVPFSCDMLDFQSKLDDPNEATPKNADADLLFNNMQLSFARFYNNADALSSQIMRMRAMTRGYTYDAAYGSASGNTMWNIAFAEIFPDYDALVAIAQENELTAHIGAAKVLKAYVMMTLVDFFGAYPYSEIGQGINNPNPAITETDADLYNIAKGLLEEAITDLDPNNVSRGFPSTDLFFVSGKEGDDYRAQWRSAAYALLMKMSLNTGDFATFDNAAAQVFNDWEDFNFHYGTNRDNPNARHPWYNSQYETSDGPYMSNYYMWAMRGIGNDPAFPEVDPDKSTPDPRRRFYFYRQTDTAEGEDQFTIDCPFQPRPTHYSARDPFCLATNLAEPEKRHDGYWGRDHGNAEGIPPDGHLRTVYGIYPAGGLFDDDSFLNTKKQGTLGALGKGIWPVMDESFLHFMLAERNIGTPAVAEAHLEAGINASITKVMNYSASIASLPDFSKDIVVDGDTLNRGDYYGVSDSLITAYIDDVKANFAAATDPMDVVAKEYHLALWGNGMEAWNLYRRTGYPSGLQPTREPEQGTFPHILLYPSTYVDLNANANQRGSIGEKVFWDPGFTTLY